MSNILLSGSTGVSHVDDTLRTIVSTFEHAFPSRIHAYYLIGSYAERTAVPLSDLDCCVIFKKQFESPHEQTTANHIAQQCTEWSPIRLDLGVRPEATLNQLYPFFQVALKLGSMLVYGVDIREQLPLPTFPAYTADVIAGAQHFIARLRGLTHVNTSSVDYPDATDEFFGYTCKSIPVWYPANIDAGTKELVATVSRVATAIVVREAQQYVPGKQQAIQLYQAYIGDTWTPFITRVFQRCKVDWKYLVPTPSHERRELREICQHMLTFENTFLETYRSV